MDLAPQPFWTDDRVAELRRLWAENITAEQIGQLLGGATRNMVLGKVQRLNMPARRERGYSGKSAACWTPADIDTLRSLHKTGQAYTAIAKAMNRSRGAIEKKCRELDLPKRWNFHAGNAARWGGNQKKPKGHNLYFGTGFHRRPKLATAPSFPKTPHPDGMKPVRLLERTGCCFPVNEGGPYLFCDMPTDGHTYCGHHWRRMVAA